MTARAFPPGFDLRQHTLLAFATPIVQYVWPDSEALNAGLREVILEAERERPGVAASNVGGWHSDTDLFTWPDAPVRALRGRVQAMAGELTRVAGGRDDVAASAEFGIEAWANVVRSGAYHSAHKHPNYMWSGVYYVDAGEPDPGPPHNGHLELIDPRDAAGMVSLPEIRFTRRQIIAPEPGLMVVFPAWLKHYVHPYVGEGARISVAFNVVVIDYRIAD